MGWLNDLWATKAKTWTYAPLNPANVPGNATPTTVEKETVYLQIRLKSLHIRDVRRGVSKFYGTVHSWASVAHRSGTNAEFSALTTPGGLKDVDTKNLDKVIGVDFPLLGPVPYRGAGLALQVGLFSITSENLAGPFLGVLDTLSQLSGVAFVTTAQAFAKPLLQGINALTRKTGDAELEIGLSMQTSTPQTGYYAVIRAPLGSIDVRQLTVAPTNFSLLDARGSPLQDPYMVLEVSVSDTRDDWFMIPEIQKPYAELREAVRGGNFEEVKKALVAFERAAWTSDDLLIKDAKTLSANVRKETTDLFPDTTTSGEKKQELKELRDMGLYS